VINDNLELVEPTRPDPSVQKPKFEEKYGVDRVVENFECHMWPNMVFHFIFEFHNANKKG